MFNSILKWPPPLYQIKSLLKGEKIMGLEIGDKTEPLVLEEINPLSSHVFCSSTQVVWETCSSWSLAPSPAWASGTQYCSTWTDCPGSSDVRMIETVPWGRDLTCFLGVLVTYIFKLVNIYNSYMVCIS